MYPLDTYLPLLFIKDLLCHKKLPGIYLDYIPGTAPHFVYISQYFSRYSFADSEDRENFSISLKETASLSILFSRQISIKALIPCSIPSFRLPLCLLFVPLLPSAYMLYPAFSLKFYPTVRPAR